MRSVPICLVLAAVLALPAAALAGKDKGKKKNHDQGIVETTFSYGQRDSVRLYFVDKHGRGNCPPGLAKKNNGCLPPGQAKKRYAVGGTLPRGV